MLRIIAYKEFINKYNKSDYSIKNYIIQTIKTIKDDLTSNFSKIKKIKNYKKLKIFRIHIIGANQLILLYCKLKINKNPIYLLLNIIKHEEYKRLFQYLKSINKYIKENKKNLIEEYYKSLEINNNDHNHDNDYDYDFIDKGIIFVILLII